MDELSGHPRSTVSIHAPARGATCRRDDVQRSNDVSIHAPARGATGECRRGATRLRGFYPRSREGSDGDAQAASLRHLLVSIHAPARGATGDAAPAAGAAGVSIHAPARGATVLMLSMQVEKQFLSTLPRGERPRGRVGVVELPRVSIHAPARGATSQWCARCIHREFLSTLPRGERRRALSERPLSTRFYPRSREGSDSCGAREDERREVSIHAPARGATRRRRSIVTARRCFYPRSREGSDSSASTLSILRAKFLSTLPRGERPSK